MTRRAERLHEHAVTNMAAISPPTHWRAMPSEQGRAAEPHNRPARARFRRPPRRLDQTSMRCAALADRRARDAATRTAAVPLRVARHGRDRPRRVAAAPDVAAVAHTLNLETDPRASLLLARERQGRSAGPPAAHRHRPGGADDASAARPRRASWPAIPRRSSTPTSPISRSGAWRSRARTSTAVLPGPSPCRPVDVRSDLVGADALIAAEASAVAHLNDDHRDALALYATALAGLPPGAWRATGLDPEGIDLAAGDLTARVAFPERLTSRDAAPF